MAKVELLVETRGSWGCIKQVKCGEHEAPFIADDLELEKVRWMQLSDFVNCRMKVTITYNHPV